MSRITQPDSFSLIDGLLPLALIEFDNRRGLRLVDFLLSSEIERISLIFVVLEASLLAAA